MNKKDPAKAQAKAVKRLAKLNARKAAKRTAKLERDARKKGGK